MRIAFLGTPDFAVPALRGLADAGHEIACVYSQPARPRARGQTVRPSPVEAFAIERGFPVRTPASMKMPEEVAAFAALDLDVAVVVAYGQILLPAVLDAPRHGCFNLHASLLPRWRGAAPIQRAIMAGDTRTGVQVMRMTAGLDEGPVLMGEVVDIRPGETGSSLHDRLSALGEALAPAALERLAAGPLTLIDQPVEGVTYARKIRPAEAAIDWTRSATELDRTIRGLSAFPGAWTQLQAGGKSIRLKVLNCRPDAAPETAALEPGCVLDDRLLIRCGTGALRLLQVQREGRAAQDAGVFLNGNPVASGQILGS